MSDSKCTSLTSLPRYYIEGNVAKEVKLIHVNFQILQEPWKSYKYNPALSELQIIAFVTRKLL